MDESFCRSFHHLYDIDLLAEGFDDLDLQVLTAAATASVVEDARDSGSEEVSLERGEELFERSGCMGCHTTDGSSGTGIGPTLQGLYGSERVFQDGRSEERRVG